MRPSWDFPEPCEETCIACGAPHAETDHAPQSPSRSDGLCRNCRAGRPSRTAERRMLTVMFCDLVGSTQLAVRLDPEDLLQVISAYQSCIAEIVERYGGFTARFMGDGVLVYFGWPRSDETDAERAVSAGLAVVEAVGRLCPLGEELRARIGIATGVVVIGEVIGPGAAQEQAVVGEAPNLAAKLQALADPASIMISQATRGQIGDLFDCKDAGQTAINGYASPVQIWRVLAKRPDLGRFEALRAPLLRPMVGRGGELELLVERWQEAKAGHGRVVLVSGEAGIGKSRLARALADRLAGEAQTSVRLSCSPHLGDTVLQPIIAQLERDVRFERGDTLDTRMRKLRAAFSAQPIADDDITLLADLMALSPVGRPALNLAPARRKSRTFDVLIRRLRVLARLRPVLLQFEDVHWADPTTLELIELTIASLRELPVLLLLTARPDFRPGWTAHAGVSVITLGRLDESHSQALVRQLAAASTLPDRLVERIVTSSDGVPLFVEELTKVVLEHDALRVGSTAGAANISVPDTLQASLMARLDRLPLAKDVAQIAAVIGRAFSHAVLADVALMPQHELQRGLDQLVGAELVFRRALPQGAGVTYTFKHALVQDVAYESLLRSRRGALHARVVDVLSAQLPDIEETRPGLLAHHCAQAGLIERAATCYKRAGEHSAERAALAETRNQLERGLALVATLPDTADRRILEVECKLALGRVLLSIRGNADSEAGEAFTVAVALCKGLDRIELLTRATWGQWFNSVHRDGRAMRQTGEPELLRLGRQHDDAAAQMVGHAMQGIAALWQGRLEDSRRSLQSALDLGGKPGTDIDLAIVSDRLADHVRMLLALALACLGRLDAAGALAATAQATAVELSHLPSRAIITSIKCRHDWFVGDDAAHRRSAMTLLRLADEQAFPFYLALGRCHLGWLEAKQGRIADGLALLEDGLETFRRDGATIWRPLLRGMAAEAQIFAGNAAEAHHQLDAAVEQANLAWYDAELHRIRAQAWLAGDPPDPIAAEHGFRQAIGVARRQGGRLWEAKAATGLARLLIATGRRAEARALLRPLQPWFVEGRGNPVTTEVAALLAELDAQVG